MEDVTAGSLYRKWLPIFGVIIILIAVGSVLYKSYFSTADMPIIKKVQDFSLERMDGQNVKLSDSNGKVRLISFIFLRCPDVCPLTTQHMVDLQNELKEAGMYGKDIEFISVTFDYENDTPEALQKYAKAVQADPSGWQFLRGPDDIMKPILNDFWIGAEKQKDGLYVHTMKTFLLDKNQNIRQIYGMADDMDKEKILREMKKLVKE
ncbi:SCO1/SenC family protein [Brevibacillus laterosporus GI-9]|uniref:SCO family protein n=1 Tax=Brevibacillus laterosporus TaxID=1465 RepID=UPI00024038C3|nr:SCO family protein [Brevibacillus laterosporus]CCF16237.1 SCO1/SenC family protein [Brevibacillus laterosporus GI-9]